MHGLRSATAVRARSGDGGIEPPSTAGNDVILRAQSVYDVLLGPVLCHRQVTDDGPSPGAESRGAPRQDFRSKPPR